MDEWVFGDYDLLWSLCGIGSCCSAMGGRFIRSNCQREKGVAAVGSVESTGTVDGSEIRPVDSLIGSLSYYLRRVLYIPGGAGFLP